MTPTGQPATPEAEDLKTDSAPELAPCDIARLRAFFELLDRWDRELSVDTCPGAKHNSSHDETPR